MGFIKEREADYLLSLFPKEANFYLSTPNIERAMPLTILKSLLKHLNLKI